MDKVQKTDTSNSEPSSKTFRDELISGFGFSDYFDM
jgi:hypothetical protein